MCEVIQIKEYLDCRPPKRSKREIKCRFTMDVTIKLDCPKCKEHLTGEIKPSETIKGFLVCSMCDASFRFMKSI